MYSQALLGDASLSMLFDLEEDVALENCCRDKGIHKFNRVLRNRNAAAHIVVAHTVLNRNSEVAH